MRQILWVASIFSLSWAFASPTTLSGRDEIAVRYQPDEKGQVHIKKSENYNMPSYRGFLQVSFTYWKPTQDSMHTLRTQSVGTVSVAESRPGEVIFPEMNWRPGFKIAAGACFVDESLELLSNYTWFFNMQQSDRSYDFSGGPLAFGIWVERNVTKASSQWRNRFQSVDLQLAAVLNPIPRLEMKPFLGGIAAWESQIWNLFQYNQDPQTTYFDLYQHWWRFGPEIGTRNNYAIYRSDSCRFDFMGSVALAQTWGRTKARYLDYTAENPRRIASWAFYKAFRPEAMLDVQIGFGYDQHFSWSRGVDVYLNAMWELQTWFQHAHYGNFATKRENGSNFNLEGLTLNAGVVY